LVKNNGVYTFSSANFFPFDGAGWDVYPGVNDWDSTTTACTQQSDCYQNDAYNNQSCVNGFCWNHNFGFTTEWHTAFLYNGGEQFAFEGDDDVWVFINKQLVVDLGGVHNTENGSISVDTLGLTIGQNYPLEIFQAERHPSGSDFRIDTTLMFTDCGGTYAGPQ
jgi:fibro-slime domain-containing protein